MFQKISQYSQENTCLGVSFIKLQAWRQKNFNKTPAQVFSCEYSENIKNTYFEEHRRRQLHVQKLTIETLEQGVKYAQS